MTEYNGWANKATWNVSMWFNNDEGMYNRAVEFMKADTRHVGEYFRFIKQEELLRDRTPDGYLWDGAQLDYQALNAMMKELI